MSEPRCTAKTRKGTRCLNAQVSYGLCRMHLKKDKDMLISRTTISREIKNRYAKPEGTFVEVEKIVTYHLDDEIFGIWILFSIILSSVGIFLGGMIHNLLIGIILALSSSLFLIIVFIMLSREVTYIAKQ